MQKPAGPKMWELLPLRKKKKKVKEIFNIYLFLKYILKLIESSYIEEISKVKLEPSISALGFVITIIIQTVLIFL